MNPFNVLHQTSVLNMFRLSISRILLIKFVHVILKKKNFTDYLFHKIDLSLVQDDFRSHAMSFFHILDVFCLLTKEILNDSLTKFDRTSLINTRVLSQREFISN